MLAQRRMLIAGNWKMNPPTAAEARALAEQVVASTALAGSAAPADVVEVVVCPPTIWLPLVRDALRGSGIGIGAQTMHWEARGAFTGETSPAMLVDDRTAPAITHVIIGHSERRQFDGETDEKVALKVAAAVAYGLVPIAAIGETLDQRQAGETDAVVRRQLEAAISELSSSDPAPFAIAYEPVWAIGTGLAASEDDAQAVAAAIREVLSVRFGSHGESVPILYGGSVTSDNARSFLAQADIDGALVGGASLKPVAFAAIVGAAADAAP